LQLDAHEKSARDQLKPGHCVIKQYLHLSKNRPTAQCWWRQCPTQMRDHLLKVCPEWKAQQKILWAEVQKESREWKSRWGIRDILADGSCGQVVLVSLSSTDVGRLVPTEEDAGNNVLEWQLQQRWEWEAERRAEAEVLDAEEELGDGEGLRCSYQHPLSWHLQTRSKGAGHVFLVLSFVLSIVIFHLSCARRCHVYLIFCRLNLASRERL